MRIFSVFNLPLHCILWRVSPKNTSPDGLVAFRNEVPAGPIDVDPVRFFAGFVDDGLAGVDPCENAALEVMCVEVAPPQFLCVQADNDRDDARTPLPSARL